MIKKTFIFLIVLIFISCTRMTTEEAYQSVSITKDSGKVVEKEDLLVYDRSKKEYTGKYIQNYATGEVKEITYYLEGKKEGSEKTFYKNGELESERNFLNGVKEGKEVGYFQDGDIRYEVNYSKGLKEGREKEFSKGTLIRESEFKNSKKDGEEVLYKDGEVTEKNDYRSGELISSKKIEYTGNSKKISYYSGKELTTIEVYMGDKLVERTPYKDRVKDGTGYSFRGEYPYEVTYSKGAVVEEKELFKEENYDIDIKFLGELPSRKYVLITSNRAIPKKNSSKDGKRFKSKIYYGEKFTYLGETKDYYKVDCHGETAYIDKSYSTLRRFDFNRMATKLKEFDDFIKTYSKTSDVKVINHYIDPTSKKNDKGVRDAYGSRGEQAAIATYVEDGVEKFRYIHDRQYIGVIEEDKEDNTISFKLPGDDKIYKTTRDEVTRKSYGEEVKKAIVLDKKSQNQGVFEKVDGEWTLISYSYINTGRDNGKDSYRTPSGEYSIAYSVPYILFLSKKDDGNDTKGDFGIRFSGGGYIHGIPYSKNQYIELDGELEPVILEGEKKLGIYPTTHKCVRNPQKHGEFLYDWLGAKEIRDGRYRIPEETSIVISY